MRKKPKLQIYTTVQRREQINKVASSLHKSASWLYEGVIANVDENVEIPEQYFSLNGGQGATPYQANLTQEAYDKVTRMASVRQSLTGRAGTKAAIMRYLGDEILAKYARGEYEREPVKFGCVQMVVKASMHKEMMKLFPRKYDTKNDEWSGGISKHLREVIRSFKVEDFPKERVTKLYEEFVAETGGLHPYTRKNKQALLDKNLRPYAVALYDGEHKILDELARGGYGAKAAICYYAYKLAYEKATKQEADKRSLKRAVVEAENTHECGMELPEVYKSMKPRDVPEIIQRELRKDVAALKTDVGMLKNTQKKLIWAIKRLNEQVFSRKRSIWHFQLLVIWTVVTVLVTLGIVSLVD